MQDWARVAARQPLEEARKSAPVWRARHSPSTVPVATSQGRIQGQVRDQALQLPILVPELAQLAELADPEGPRGASFSGRRAAR
jgi:hypothetical protein